MSYSTDPKTRISYGQEGVGLLRVERGLVLNEGKGKYDLGGFYASSLRLNGHIIGSVSHNKILQCFVRLFGLRPVFLDCNKFSTVCKCVGSHYVVGESLFPVAVVNENLDLLELPQE